MSDDTKQGGFWTTVPGILTGIAGVLGGVLAIIKVFHPDGTGSPNPTASAAPNQNAIASFVVNAKDKQGLNYYSNQENEPIKIRYKAKKNDFWVVVPNNYPGNNLPKGDISLDGDRNFPANNSYMPCPGVPIGALVVVKKNGQCVASGAEGTFSLDPSEKASFLVNDVKTKYNDNDGSATVQLYKTN
ncbi:hypothetical protein BV378_02390 [Nostoc sp. RF31YmG]|nr:hypothetical protein BV378_02390 [Nostoc sp. RF31YmG]